MFTIYADGQLLYSNGLQETNTILTPTLKLEVGKAGSLDFVMLPGHYLYNVIDKLKTKVVAFMDETEIFRGRVLNWETDFYKQRTVYCEGNLAYLLDSLQPPRRTTMTVSAYLQEIVNEHNLQVGIEKQFTLGSVIITGGNTAVEFENTSFRDTRSAIDSELIGVYGGFLRTRTVGTVTYLDYIQNYGSSATQKLEFGSNILDMSQSLSSTEIFTVLLPTGDSVETTPGIPPLPVTIESVNGGSKLIEHLDGISKFGRIVHTENFSGITDPAALKAAGEAYIARVYTEPYLTYNIKALDLHLLDTDIQQFAVGHLIRIVSPPHGVDVNLTCLSISYDMENVENTELIIGPLLDIPGGPASLSSGQSLSSAVGAAMGGASGSGGRLGQAYKFYTEGDDWAKIQAKKIELIGETITLQSGSLATHGTLITQNKDAIILEAATRDTLGQTLNSALTVEAGRITAEVTRAKGKEDEISGKLTVEADKITAEVGRSIGKENELSGRITVTEGQIDLRVTKEGIITAINIAPGTVTINADKVNVPGIITAGAIAVQGDISAANARFDNLVAGNTTASRILAYSMGVNGTLTAGKFETSGIVVGSELQGTNIYGGTIYLGGVSIGPRISSLESDASYFDTNITNLWDNFLGYSPTSHNHSGVYAPVHSHPYATETAYTNLANATASALAGKLATGGKAADSDLLDGYHASSFALAHTHPYSASNHDHAGVYDVVGHGHAANRSKTVVTDIILTSSKTTVRNSTNSGTVQVIGTVGISKTTSTIGYYAD